MRAKASTVARLLERGVNSGVFPGGQAAIVSTNYPDIEACAGLAMQPHGKLITPDTLFDIASLTKLFTSSAALRLVDQKAIELNAPVDLWLPELADAPAVPSLAQLLAHEAGFEPWLPLFERVPDGDRGSAAGKAAVVQLAAESRSTSISDSAATYSDLGFIVLGHLLERAAGLPLKRLIEREVIEPLELKSVHFRPLSQSADETAAGMAATEHCPWRNRILVGEVHDDNAWVMGGVAGHAGLFATARDMAAFGQAWLRALTGSPWLSGALAGLAVTRRAKGRGLGWDLKSPESSSAGTLMSDDTFGHLGFTGCSLWIDPKRQLAICLLTNRIHPTRENTAISSFRPAFHDEVVKLLNF